MHYVVDLNYFPGYKEVPHQELQTAVDDLVRKEIAIHRGERAEDDEEDEEDRNARFLKYALVGIGALAVAATTVYKATRRS